MQLRYPSQSETGRIVIMTDVHGRYDAFKAAFDAIEDKPNATFIYMGDAIDRGPNSLGVLKLLREIEMGKHGFKDEVLLPGNHEQMCWMGCVGGDDRMMNTWLMNGGLEVIKELNRPGLTEEELIKEIIASLPQQFVMRLDGRMPLYHQIGDLLFVHAGVSPDPAIQKDHLEDRYNFSALWIRSEFLDHSGGFRDERGNPCTVIHGHTAWQASSVEGFANLILAALDSSGRLSLDTTYSPYVTMAEIEDGKFSLRFFNENGECVPDWSIVDIPSNLYLKSSEITPS